MLVNLIPFLIIYSLQFEYNYSYFDICDYNNTNVQINDSIIIISPFESSTLRYPSNTHCELRVLNENSSYILMKIDFIQMEWSPGCLYRDYLSIETHNKSEYHCGKIISEQIVTNSLVIKFQFHSDVVIEDFGFQIKINLLKNFQKTNKACSKTFFVTHDELSISTSELQGEAVKCFTTVISKTKIGIEFNLLVQMNRNHLNCEDSFVKFQYYHIHLKKMIEHIYCGVTNYRETKLVIYGEIINITVKFHAKDELIIRYNPIAFPEFQHLVLNEINYIQLPDISQIFPINLNNQSKLAEDVLNRSCLFGFKIHGQIGFGIDLIASKDVNKQFKILVADYFVYDVNFITIRSMAKFSGTKYSTNSFQITVVVQYFDCYSTDNPIDLQMTLKLSNLTLKHDLIKNRITPIQIMNWQEQKKIKEIIQIRNRVDPSNKHWPFYSIKIRKLSLFTNLSQDLSCNQSGLYIYDNSNKLFGPFCHSTDFIPIEKIPFTLVYYYFFQDDFIYQNYHESIIEIDLNFYPCHVGTLHTNNLYNLDKCVVLYQPVENQSAYFTTQSIMILSREKVSLFEFHSQMNIKFINPVMDIKNKLILPIYKSDTCYFELVISQKISGKNSYIVLVSINTTCSVIPNNWSVHLEYSSRQRIECNGISNIQSGIIYFDFRSLANHATRDSVEICVWHFTKPQANRLNTVRSFHRINILSLEVDVLSLNCDKYSFFMHEKIGKAIHRIKLCEGVKEGDIIRSRSDANISISLNFNNRMHSMMKIEPLLYTDEFFIHFKYTTMFVKHSNEGCDYNWWRFENNCYKLVKSTEEISWSDAELTCQSYSSTLVKIDSENEMKHLQNLSMTVWLEEIYSDTSILIFIGLRNNNDHFKSDSYKEDLYYLTWTQGEPMLYHEWFQRSPTSIYSYASDTLKRMINMFVQQPSVENNGHLCTAMMWQHPMYWSNWVKIPCDYKFFPVNFICEKPVHLIKSNIPKNYFENELIRFNDINSFQCSESWFFVNDRCLMLVKANDEKTDKLSLCENKKSKLAELTHEEAEQISNTLLQFLTVGSHFYTFYELDNYTSVVPSYYATSKEEIDGYVICERAPEFRFDEYKKQFILSNVFWCGDEDLYWISVDHICDSHVDCLLSGNDEKNCPTVEALRSIESRQILYDCDVKSDKYVSWNKYCNFVDDCQNVDEASCNFPRCNETTEWRCHNEQCIRNDKRCNKFQDCFDGSDEKDCNISMCNGFKCKSSVCLPNHYVMDDIVDCPGSLKEDEILSKENCYEKPEEIKSPCSKTSNKCIQLNNTCIYHRDYLITRDLCPLSEHLQHCQSFVCPGLFQCHKIKYCIQLHYLCDGIIDCPDGEDEKEENCRQLKCPYNFRCWSENRKYLNCVDRKNLCNGIKDCDRGEDELYCEDNQCPKLCKCVGYQIICDSMKFVNFYDFSLQTRSLTITNAIIIDLHPGNLSSFIYLGYLNMSDIHELGLVKESFVGLFNLIYLILVRDNIETLPEYAFSSLKQLKVLDLTGNPIKVIESNAFHDLVNVEHIQLASMKFETINDNVFFGMSSKLVSINMTDNDIRSINQFAFRGITNLSILAINVNRKDISLTKQPLINLTVEKVYTNVYKICCSLASYKTCSAETDISSNCEDLLANKIILVIVWSMGIFGFLGNIVVILWRILARRKNKFSTDEILIVNLALSDLLMGAYLIIIASVDSYYRNQYIENSIIWKSSLLCVIAGYIATVSNQTSVTFIGLILLDRFICIVFSRFRELASKIKYLIVPVWIMWVVAVGIFRYYYNLEKDNYESSGLCLSYFSFIDEYPYKKLVSVALLSYILIFLVLIVTGYVIIFIHTWRLRKTAGRTFMLNDYRSAKKLLMLILVCCICWFPIIVLSILSRCNIYQLGNDQLAWFTVVLMPINSSLNPYLYTFSNVNFCFRSKVNHFKARPYVLDTLK